MAISWKAFWAVLGGVLALCLGVLLHLFAVGVLLAALVLLATVGAVSGGAWWATRYAAVFDQLRSDERTQITGLITAAAGVNVVFLLLWTLTPRLWPVWSVVLIAVAVATYFVAGANEYARARMNVRRTELARQTAERRDPQVYAFAPGQQPNAQTDRIEIINFRKALRRANLGYLIVSPEFSVVSDNAGDPFGIRFTVRTPANMIRADGKNNLSASHAEAIAAGISEEYATEIEAGWVSIVKKKAAGVYTITSVTEDIMARVFPYYDDPSPTTITEPALVGYTIEAQPYYQPLAQHGSDVGMSTSGKSSLVHVKLAHTTRCTDQVDWICGVEKLYDLVAPWIEPYLEEYLAGEDLPFDWIAAGGEDSATMISAAMTVARWRQRQPMSKRQGFATIIVWLDEASFTLNHPHAQAVYDGAMLDASKLVENGTKGAASGSVYFKLVSQRGTHNNWGASGGDIQANLKDNAVFMTNDPQEIGRATGDYKLPMPQHKGENWLNPGTGDLPTRLKAPYIQTDDPSKPVLHTGPKISDVARSRARIKKKLDAGSAAVAGQAYARRARTAQQVLSYVNGTDMSAEDLSPRQRQAEQEALAEIAEMDAELGIAGGDERPQLEAPRPAPTMPVGPPKQNRPDRIVAIVASAEEPLTRADIITALREQYEDTPSDQVVTNALAALVKDKRLTKPEGTTNQYLCPTTA